MTRSGTELHPCGGGWMSAALAWCLVGFVEMLDEDPSLPTF